MFHVATAALVSLHTNPRDTESRPEVVRAADHSTAINIVKDEIGICIGISVSGQAWRLSAFIFCCRMN